MSNRNKQQHNPRPGGGAGARYSNDNKGSRNEFSNGSDVKGNRGSFGERRGGPNVPGADLYAGPMMMPPPQMMPPVMPGVMMMGHPGGGPGMMPPPGIPGQGFPAPFTNGAPTYDLPVREKDDKKKFTGRCRLFVAGIPPNVKEEDIKNLFEQYGEVSEVFLGKQNSFAFVKMDTRKHAEEARDSLDNKNYEGRILRVRLAAHAAAVRVKNLSQVVTNELLEHAFSYFGEVERAVVITDDRGRSVGEGIVEFARKVAAQICLKRCSQECFLLTANPAPVIVEPFEQRDEEEGFSEKHINRNSLDFKIEREVGPRFADPTSFEFDFGSRFKQLYEIEREKRARLENEINDGRRELMEQMEFQRVEYQKKLLKDKLREMEEKVNAFEGVRNRSLEEEKVREEQRQREEMSLRQREEDLLRRNQFRDFQARQEGEPFRAETSAIQDLLSRVSYC